MSQQEAERLLAAARAEPIPSDVVAAVRRRLDDRPARVRLPWSIVALAAAGVAMIVLRPDTADRAPLEPGITKRTPSPFVAVEPEMVSPRTPHEPTTPETKSLPLASEQVPAVDATPKPQRALARPAARPPSPVDSIQRVASVRAETERDPRRRIGGYRPRAVRELVENNRARLAGRALSSDVRRVLATTDRTQMLAVLDATVLDDDADLLALRGALRASAERCTEALVDFERTRFIAPESAASNEARIGATWCQ